MTSLVVRPAAVGGLTEAHARYSGVAEGRDDRFVTAVDALFVRLAEFPRSAPLVAGCRDVRCAVVRGLPCVVCCRYQPDRIDVLRV